MEVKFSSRAASAMWKPVLQKVYLLSGEEDRLKDEALEALVARVVPEEWKDFDLERLDAGLVTAEEILAAARQIAFGAERRLVIVKGMDQWRDRGKNAEIDRLSEGIATLSDTACLVLMTAAQEEEGRRKTAVGPKLDNAVKKYGCLVECRPLKDDDLVAWVEALVLMAGKRIGREAAELLISSVNGEMLQLEQEIAKLCGYVGERAAITAQDVGTLVAVSPEDVMFSTVDAITRRHTERALALLSQLHRYDPKPQAVAGKLLALLARQYRLLWQARFLVDQRVNPRDVRSLPLELAGELPSEVSIMQPNIAFRAGDLFAAARKWNWNELTEALEALLMCDLANKGGATEEVDVYGADPARNLQLLTLQLTGSARAV